MCAVRNLSRRVPLHDVRQVMCGVHRQAVICQGLVRIWGTLGPVLVQQARVELQQARRSIFDEPGVSHDAAQRDSPPRLRRQQLLQKVAA